MQKIARQELALADSCTSGRGLSVTRDWTRLNQDMLEGGVCDLRHVLLIEMGLLDPMIREGVNPRESPPWFRGNWRNMVKVIQNVHSMQFESRREHKDLRGSDLVQVIPVKWTSPDGNLDGAPVIGTDHVKYTAYRHEDKSLERSAEQSTSGSDEYWMPQKIELLAKSRSFLKKAGESPGPKDQGWIAIPFGASLISKKGESWKESWGSGVPASLWSSLEGPPIPFGEHRRD